MNARVSLDLDVATTSIAVAARPLVRIVIVGHVDHGKSTLIGRLLAETGSLPDGKLEQLKAVSARRGMPFELSFLLDELQTERDQGITIDTSQIRFRTASRDFVLIDAPGHTEFLRNMVTGASQADGALLIVDEIGYLRGGQIHQPVVLGRRLDVAVLASQVAKCAGIEPQRFQCLERYMCAPLTPDRNTRILKLTRVQARQGRLSHEHALSEGRLSSTNKPNITPGEGTGIRSHRCEAPGVVATGPTPR